MQDRGSQSEGRHEAVPHIGVRSVAFERSQVIFPGSGDVALGSRWAFGGARVGIALVRKSPPRVRRVPLRGQLSNRQFNANSVNCWWNARTAAAILAVRDTMSCVPAGCRRHPAAAAGAAGDWPRLGQGRPRDRRPRAGGPEDHRRRRPNGQHSCATRWHTSNSSSSSKPAPGHQLPSACGWRPARGTGFAEDVTAPPSEEEVPIRSSICSKQPCTSAHPPSCLQQCADVLEPEKFR
jgi:hypothetical protein